MQYHLIGGNKNYNIHEWNIQITMASGSLCNIILKTQALKYARHVSF